MKGIHNVREALKIMKIRPYFLVLLLWTIGWGISVQWYATYSILNFNTSQQAISLGLLVQGGFWAIGASVVNSHLVKRFVSLPVALAGLALTFVFLILASLPNNFITFNLFYCPSALFSAFGFSNVMNLVSINAPANIQGKINGISQSVMSLGWIIVPILGGITGSTYIHLFYPLSAALILLAVVVLFIKWRPIKAA